MNIKGNISCKNKYIKNTQNNVFRDGLTKINNATTQMISKYSNGIFIYYLRNKLTYYYKFKRNNR